MTLNLENEELVRTYTVFSDNYTLYKHIALNSRRLELAGSLTLGWSSYDMTVARTGGWVTYLRLSDGLTCSVYCLSTFSRSSSSRTLKFVT